MTGPAVVYRARGAGRRLVRRRAPRRHRVAAPAPGERRRGRERLAATRRRRWTPCGRSAPRSSPLLWTRLATSLRSTRTRGRDAAAWTSSTTTSARRFRAWCGGLPREPRARDPAARLAHRELALRDLAPELLERVEPARL